jgi:hypothetical protein
MGSGFIEQDQVFCSDCTASAGEQSNRHCCVRINTIMDPRQKHSGMTRQKSQTGLTGKSRLLGCRTNDQSNRHSCIRHSCVFLTGILAGIHSTVAEEQGLLGASMRLALRAALSRVQFRIVQDEPVPWSTWMCGNGLPAPNSNILGRMKVLS